MTDKTRVFMLLKEFLVVSRANIQIASLPTAAIGIVLASKNWADLLNLSAYLYIILFFVVLTYSCNINCLNDLDVDKRYKKYLSNAVNSIGIPKLKVIMMMELLLAGVIIISLCIMKNEIIYLLAVIGIMCGYIYSAPPLRIKKRGIFSPVPVMFGLYFLPIIAGWYIMTNRLSVLIIFFGIGYALIMQGITFVNTCEDFKEDKTAGIRTFAHVIGVRKTLFLGSIFVSVGGLIDLVLLLFIRINMSTLRVIPSVIIVLLGVFFFFSISYISRNLYLVGVSANPIALCKKNAAKMPVWFITTRYPLFFISLLLIL